jgi:MFS family permease
MDHELRKRGTSWLFPTILGLALFQGFLGMGFQLVASRLLAPYFGTTLIVWAFLISSFLAAFSIGSFFGGSLSRLTGSPRRHALIALVIVGVGWFGIVAFAGRPVMRFLEATFEEAWVGIGLACVLLFLAPVAALSALLPIYTELLAHVPEKWIPVFRKGHAQTQERGGRGAGSSSGLIYGTSTFGNIVGVMVTAFALIPNFLTSELLVGWFVCSFACFAGAYLVANGASGESPT